MRWWFWRLAAGFVIFHAIYEDILDMSHELYETS